MFLKILLGLVLVYLSFGVYFTGFALYYMAINRSTNEEYAHQFDSFAAYSFKLKVASVLLAIWYGVICWLPIAAGWMTRPTKFKFR